MTYSVGKLDLRDDIINMSKYLGECTELGIEDTLAYEQLRALFMSYCMLFNVGVDTGECDALLCDMCRFSGNDDTPKTCQDFEDDMVMYLV